MIDIFRRFFARVTPFQRRCGVGGALLVALGAALLVTMTANGDAGGGGNGSPPQSPGSIFASRSPGARLAGALHQTAYDVGSLHLTMNGKKTGLVAFQ